MIFVIIYRQGMTTIGIPCHCKAVDWRAGRQEQIRNPFPCFRRPAHVNPSTGLETIWKIPGAGFHLRPLVPFRMLSRNETPTGFLASALRTCSVMLPVGRSGSAFRGLGLECACRSSPDVISAGECSREEPDLGGNVSAFLFLAWILVFSSVEMT